MLSPDFSFILGGFFLLLFTSHSEFSFLSYHIPTASSPTPIFIPFPVKELLEDTPCALFLSVINTQEQTPVQLSQGALAAELQDVGFLQVFPPEGEHRIKKKHRIIQVGKGL